MSAAVVLAAMAAAVLVAGTGVSAWLRGVNPAMAMKFMPRDARALAGAAAKVAEKIADPRQQKRAEALALASIRIDASLASPYRLLALIADLRGDRKRALRLMKHSELLSRRDLPTQLWFIEYNVRKGDVIGALHHYDIALRTSLPSRSMLYPILANALGDPAVIVPLADLLTKPVPWREDFLYKAIDTSQSLPGLVSLADILSQRRAPFNDTALQQLLYRLVDARQIDLAVRLRNVAALPERDKRIVDAKFIGQGRQMYPFAWIFGTAQGVLAERLPPQGERPTRLEFQTSGYSAGEVVRQLTVLEPGRYRFSFLGGSDANDNAARPIWTLQCFGRGGQVFSQKILGSAKGARGGLIFQIPANDCAAQWLRLDASAASSSEGGMGWVTAIELTPA